jgi:hypothetical protein
MLWILTRSQQAVSLRRPQIKGQNDMFKSRKNQGTSLAELPVNLWVFVFFLMFPFIDFVTLSYRATFAYFGVHDATYKAALQTTFTNAMATADSTLGTDAAAWRGISYSNTQVFVVQVDQNGLETVGPANSPWAAAINQNDVYLIRIATVAQEYPLIDGNFTVVKIAGVNAPISTGFTVQVAAEHPQGLTQ